MSDESVTPAARMFPIQRVGLKAAQAGKPIRTVILELLAAWVKS